MISVIVYGRNDSHGYNLPKRAALSFNCIAEVLTHPNDEIVFVDCNTPDDLPTFPESIADTLTSRAKELLRILRLRPDQYERGRNGTKFKVLEPLCRNVGIRRTNPKNRWVLNTNTDMVFAPLPDGHSLSDVVAGLPDGFYELPRFEMPEILWETSDRFDPKAIIRSFKHWGRRLHINEMVANMPEIRFDGPGDFQLALRDQLFQIHGMDERMTLGWHVDSNLCKRMFLLNGQTRSLLDKVWAYHCDHTRLNTPYHSVGESTQNDMHKFFYDVKSPFLPEQARSWGLPAEQIEDFRLTGEYTGRYARALESLVPGLSEPMIESALTGSSFNHGLLYDNKHVLAYVTDHLTMLSSATDIGYFGANVEMLRLVAAFRHEYGHTGRVLFDEAMMMTSSNAQALDDLPPTCQAARADHIFSHADLCCFDAWMGHLPIHTNSHGYAVPLPSLAAADFGIQLLQRCVEFAKLEKMRCEAPGMLPRKSLFLGTQHTWFERAPAQLFGLVMTPFSSYVRHGFVRRDSQSDSIEPLHGLGLIFRKGEMAERMEIVRQMLPQPVEEAVLFEAEMRVRGIASELCHPSCDLDELIQEPAVTAADCAFLELEMKLAYLGGCLSKADRMEKLLDRWRERGVMSHKLSGTTASVAPTTAIRRRGRKLTVGIDARTFFYTDSASRGIGHYALNHLSHVIPLRSDWQFLLLVENDHPVPALKALSDFSNVRVCRFDECAAIDLDLMHIPDPMNLSVGFDSPMRLFPEVPATAIFYDLTPLRQYWHNWPDTARQAYLLRLRQMQQRNLHLLAISEYTRQDLLKASSFPADRASVIMAGLNRSEGSAEVTKAMAAEIRQKYKLSKPFFLHVGALDPHKNFEAVIQSISRIRAKEDVQLVVVGEKDHFLKQIAAHCEKMMTKNIIFPGYIPRTDLEVLYHEAVALLFLSRYEGFGFPVLEAMAQGCPVITTNATSIPEVAGDAALVFAPDDYASISQGMDQLLGDHKLRESLRAKGLVQAAKFPWTEPARKTMQVWETILGGVAAAAPAEFPEQSLKKNDTELQGHLCSTIPPSSAAPAEPGMVGPTPTDTRLKAASGEPFPPPQAEPANSASSSPTPVPVKPATVPPPATPLRTAPGLVWLAPWQNPSGYTSEALTLASALVSSEPIELLDVAKVKSPAFVAGLPADLRQLLHERLRTSVATTNRICLSHFPASGFSPLPTAAWNIGRTMFETDRLPHDWVTRCNQMDEVWVPSKFNLETFAQSGVERDKLHVIPGAVDPAQFDTAHHAPLPLANRAACNFLSVFEWSLRKGWDVLLAAYLREFSAADDVCLYLRTYLMNQPDADSARVVQQLIREFTSTLNLGDKPLPRIEVISQQIPSADLPGLYRAVDCLVAPSRGEGWGRPHHEAMLMELPVIATNWSGNTEFMTAENSLPLKFELVDVEAGQDLRHYHGHRWAEPSETHLRDLMRWVQRHPAEAREVGRRARVSVSERFSPVAVAQKILQRLAAVRHHLTMPMLPPAATKADPASPLVPETQAVPISVAWDGSFLKFGSLSHVNREFTRHLATRPGVTLTCVSHDEAPEDGVRITNGQVTLGRLNRQVPRQTQVSIRHSWPPNWAAPASGAWVLMQPWEFGVLPADWVAQVEKVDEVWAYSEYVRRVYVDSGVSPSKVKVVPLGVDPRQFNPQAVPMALATAKSFKFLFVGGTIGRKGPDILLKSFLEAFTSSDDVCLVVKDFCGKSVYAGKTMADEVAAAQAKPNAPEMIYLDQEWAPEVMPSLYAACDCLVHPYRGEGFGLPVIEAMACGLPVIVTGGGATDDFATDDYAYRLPARWKTLGLEFGGVKLGKRGWWLEPDGQDLSAKMRWVLEHQQEARAKGLAASEYVRREWTWDRAAAVAEVRLRELIARRGTANARLKAASERRASPITLPPCALLGSLAEARQFLNNKKLPAAWGAVRAALKHRPFHPEAYLLMAEIALAGQDATSARACAQYARQIAPDYKPAKKFLKASLHGNLKPDWLVLPDVIRDSHATRRPHLSVCLIVKNEERFLGQCLASVEGLADQIVVVDTGSTDRSVEIAKHYKAEVHSFAWCDDFSAARNAALEHARGDWILMLDADEELPPDQHESLRKLLRNASVISWRLPLQDVGREAEGSSYVPRLYRNAPAVFYIGRVHEQVFTSLEVRREEWGLETRLGDAMLRHHGYTKELTSERDKVARNLRLLEMAVNELPQEANLLMNLGLELTRSGRKEEGLRRYREAFEALSAEPPAVVVPELREVLLTQFCTQLVAAKEHAEVIRVLTSPLAKLGSGLTASLHFTLGLAQMELKDFASAAEQFRQCLAKRDRPALTPVNLEIRKAGPRHCLASCLTQTGDSAAAEREFQTVCKEFPELAPVVSDYGRFLQSVGRAVDGLQLLHQFVSKHPQSPSAWLAGGAIALSKPEFLEVALDWTAEASRLCPSDAAILAQRAEALLLAGQPEAALPLWKQLQADAQPATLAAAILCETALGKNVSAPAHGQDGAVTQEFVNWYRKMLGVGAEPTLLRVNAGVEGLARVLPRAAELLRAVISEVGTPGK